MIRYPIGSLRNALNHELLVLEVKINASCSDVVANLIWDIVRMGVGDPSTAVADTIFIDYDGDST